MDSWRFLYWWMLLALLVPLALPFLRPRRGGAAFGAFGLARAVLRRSLGPLLHRLLIAAGLAFLVLAAARPQFGRTIQINEVRGRDLMIVVDLSLSMIADDIIAPDGQRLMRLDAVVESAKAFIDGRPTDRFGVVFFSEEALLGCPLTFDHETVVQFLEDVRQRQKALWKAGYRENRPEEAGLLGSGTNLGLGLGEALASLRDEEADGRAMILITDGRDTEPDRLANWVDPVAAARHAKDLGVNVYAIGVGNRRGDMHHPVALYRHGERHLIQVSGNMLPDMNRLQEIVEEGDGLLMRADNLGELDQVFDRIDQLEPSRHEVRSVDRYADRFVWPLALGLMLLAAGLLAEPRLRGVP